MNDLIKRISAKFGLTDEKSYAVVKMVLDFLKDKLPEPAAAEINKILIAEEGKDNPGNAIKDLGSKFTTK